MDSKKRVYIPNSPKNMLTYIMSEMSQGNSNIEISTIPEQAKQVNKGFSILTRTIRK